VSPVASDEELWCAERRAPIAECLREQRVAYRSVGERPAWHIAPCVSVWAVESCQSPGNLGLWAICGDLPSDYVSAADIKHPRGAVRAVSRQWLEACVYLERGEQPPDTSIGNPQEAQTLHPLLRARAELLARWAADDSVWQV
jgi:hypothetical protein